MYGKGGGEGGYQSTKSLPPELLARYASKKKLLENTEKLVQGVYIWGSDEFKRLYLPALAFDRIPRFMSELDSKKPLYVAFGTGHIACSNIAGECLTWGLNEYGQLGHNDSQVRHQPQPVMLMLKHFIVQVACGSYHTLCLTREGAVWGFGKNRNGQIGAVGTSEFRCSAPLCIQFPQPKFISYIACGANHSAAVTIDGLAYIWGDNTDGQCGFKSTNEDKSVHKPTLVKGLENFKVKQIACGASHTLLLTTEDADGITAVFATGKNSEGQLGLADIIDRTEVVRIPLPGSVNVIQVACGSEHSMLLSDVGEVYSFGSNAYGQLGLGDLKNTAIPHKIVQLVAVAKMACGAYHSTALCEKGLWVWGKGNEGQLGVIDTVKQTTPVLIEDFRPKLIRRLYCGFEHTMIINYPTKGEFRSRYVRDLLEAEQDYLAALQVVSGFFLDPIHNKECPPNLINSASAVTQLFGPWSELASLTRTLAQKVTTAMMRAHCLNEKICIGEICNKSSLLDCYYRYCTSHSNSIAANTLGKLKNNQAVDKFLQNCSTKLRAENTRFVATDLEALLQLPFTTIGQYKKIFKQIAATTPSKHPDYEQTNIFFNDLKILKAYTKEKRAEAALTKAFWMKFPALECIMTYERRFVENLTKFFHIIGESSTDSHAVLLFNDSLVIARFPLDVPLHPSINPSTVIKLLDLNTIWVFEEESTNNNIFVIRTPEQRFHVICIDSNAKSKAMMILNKTISNLITPSKRKHVDFQFAAALSKLSQSNDKLTGNSLLLSPQPPVASPSLSNKKPAMTTPKLPVSPSPPTGASSTGTGSTQQSPRSASSVPDVPVSMTQQEMIQDNKVRYAKYKFSSAHATYADCVYEGEWSQYEMDGAGRMQYPSGSIFEGDWSKNSPHGRGGFFDSSAKTFYIGTWRNGLKSGKGKQEYQLTGELYNGEWKDGKRDGFGKFIGSGYKYTGRWKEDKMDGLGVQVFDSGDRYIGLFANNMKNKSGIYMYANGDYYEGEWTGDKATGRGYFYYYHNFYFASEHKHLDNRLDPCFFKGWFHMIDENTPVTNQNAQQYPGELHGPGDCFVAKGNFIPNDPLKISILNGGSVVRGSNTMRQAKINRLIRAKEFEFKSPATMGDELTNGAEWLSFFLDRNFDNDKWLQDKQFAEDIGALFEPASDHSLSTLIHEFVHMLEAGFSLPDIMRLQSRVNVKGVTETALNKLVTDIKRYQTHLNQVIVDYFNDTKKFKDSQLEKVSRDIDIALFKRVYHILYPLYDIKLKKENAKYEKKLKIFKGLTDEELFRVVEADPKFWLLNASNTPATPRANATNNNIEPVVPAPDPTSPSTSPPPTTTPMSPHADHVPLVTPVTPVVLTPTRDPSSLRRSRTAKPYAEAIRSLQEIAKQQSPLQKIKILKQAWIAIYSTVEIYTGGKHKLEALDELYPVLLYVMIRANVPNLYSECYMMGDFLTEDMSHGEEGMMTKTLQGALVHLMTYDWKQFFEIEYRVKPKRDDS